MRTAWISSIIFSFVAVIGVGIFSFFLISGKSTTKIGWPHLISVPRQVSFDDTPVAQTVSGDTAIVGDSKLNTAPLNPQAIPLHTTELPIGLPSRLPARQTQLEPIDESAVTTVMESVVAGSQMELMTKNRDSEADNNDADVEQLNPEGVIPARSAQTQSSPYLSSVPVIVDDFLADENVESNISTAPKNVTLVTSKSTDSPKPMTRAQNKGLSQRNSTTNPSQVGIARQTEPLKDLIAVEETDFSSTDNDQDIAAVIPSVARLSLTNHDITAKEDADIASIRDSNAGVRNETLNKSSAEASDNSGKVRDNTIAIIVNRANAEAISVDDIRNIYFDKIIHWQNGEKITLYNLPLNSSGREVFSRKVLNMSAIQAATEESNRVITNAALNQSQTKRERLVLSYVERNPQAIGYVPFNEAKGNNNVRIIMTMH